jgi:FkbM family methyltransferase
MPRRSLASLALDEVMTWALARMRKRAARERLFGGIVAPVDDYIGLRLMATGMFEATQIDAVRACMSSPDFIGAAPNREGLFIDVGANIGLYCIAFAKSFRRALAIEANPQTFAVLQANMALRDLDNVSCLCVAASDEARETNIYVPENGNLGWATLDSAHHSLPQKARPVTCQPLDDLIAAHGDGLPAALIKIDVEGHELAVLRGAQETLRRDQPIVLFEALNAADGAASRALLESCGYRGFHRFTRGKGRFARLVSGLSGGLDVHAEPAPTTHGALICATAA